MAIMLSLVGVHPTGIAKFREVYLVCCGWPTVILGGSKELCQVMLVDLVTFS